MNRRRLLCVLALAAFSLAMAAGATRNPLIASDASYAGSSFNEVLGVVTDSGFAPSDEIEAAEYVAYAGGVLPKYPVNYFSLGGLLQNHLTARSRQTLDERTDYYPRLQKFVHANGICVAGDWQITQLTPYTGQFKTGARGLFIGRISVALQETTPLDASMDRTERGFGFAGKLFPTMDANAVVKTTNFFTVDVLSGTRASRFLDVSLTNEPPIKIFGVVFDLSKIFPAFIAADDSPTFRPVTQLAATGPLGAREAGPVVSPIWMRLRPSVRPAHGDDSNPKSVDFNVDFRREVKDAMERNGLLDFRIEASSSTNDRDAVAGWTEIGRIRLTDKMITYGCDRRLHFNHPGDDRSNEGGEKAKSI